MPEEEPMSQILERDASSGPERPRRQPAVTRFQKSLDVALVWLGIGAVIVLVALLSFNLYAQYSNYRLGLENAAKGQKINYAAVLTFARAWDFALIKTSALFLGFLLIFSGSLYILRVHETSFNLSYESQAWGKGALASTSPGLVLSVLGVILVIVVLFSKSYLDYRDGELGPLGDPGETILNESPAVDLNMKNSVNGHPNGEVNEH